MRLLHTADWHLGLSSGPVSRAPDHERFLAWLVDHCAREAVDVVLVAGDVFDAMQPSAEALRQYYGFLRDVAGAGVRDVVVVGGNHDSPSRLDAPRDLLSRLDVHVVGGLRADTASWDRCLVPVRRRGDEAPAAVVLAVPYVHEFRLGIRTTDDDPAAVRRAFADRFSALYRHLADEAARRWPGLPIVATGHLTVGEATAEDYPQEIHQAGLLSGLPPSVFDPRIRYVALGHVHRCHGMDDGRVWYSGSPIPTRRPEAAQRRRVLQVDVAPDGPADVTPVPVPEARELITLDGSPADVGLALRTLTWTAPLPPLVYAHVRLPSPDPTLSRDLHAALDAHPADQRPALVELRQLHQSDAIRALSEPPPSLASLTPHEVFERLLEHRGYDDPSALRAAFARLVAATDDDVAALVARAEEGP